MTPTELREAIKTLGTNQSALARSIGVDPRTVRKWLAGENPIRTSAAILIRGWLDNPHLYPPLPSHIKNAQPAK